MFFGIGKLTGLLRIGLLSSQFDLGADLDAFTAANQLPEVFVTLISGGALAAAFIPVYTQYLRSTRAIESAKLANSILNLVLITLTSVSALGIVTAEWVTSEFIVPNFDVANQALTAELMRIILLQTTLFGISGVLSSILNAHQHFALPALAPIALDVGYIIGIFALVPTLGIHGVAWGTVAGGVLHIVVQIPALVRYGFSYRPTLSIKIAGVQEIIRLMGPRIVTLGSVQAADLVIIRLTSGLVAGSTSGYFYGYYIMQLPETLLGTAIAIVIFPTLAELYNSEKLEEMRRVAAGALQIIWTLTIPAGAVLVLLGRPAIAFFLERGAFTGTSTTIVYSVVVMFSVRVVSEASLEILARLFYAQHNTRTPMFVALGWLTLNTTLAFSLFENFGLRGLALASTIAFTAQVLALYIITRRTLGPLYERDLLATLVRSAAGILAMSLIVMLLSRLITSNFWLLFAGGIGAFVVYAGTIILLGAQEPRNLVRLLRSRLEVES